MQNSSKGERMVRRKEVSSVFVVVAVVLSTLAQTE